MAMVMDEEERKRLLGDAPQTEPISPVVKDYLTNKYPERFAQLSKDRSAAASDYDAQNTAPGVGGNLLMGLIGALKSDKSYADVARDEREQREAERVNALKPFDEKAKYLKEGLDVDRSAQDLEKGSFDFGRSRTTAGREDTAYAQQQKDLLESKNPESEKSLSAYQTVATFAKDPRVIALANGKSEEQIKTMMPWMKEKIEQDFKASESSKKLAADLEVERMKEARKPSTGTKGQDAGDRAFANEYTDFIVKGGYGMVQNQLASLNDAIKTLESDKSISGPIRGRLPDSVRSLTNPTAVNVKEQIAAVVQNSLRPILGSQFTQQEGENLIKRTYNDSLPSKVNAKRARRLFSQIKTMADQKKAASDYWEENGTLVGYKGGRPSMSNLTNVESEEKPQNDFTSGLKF